MDGELNLTDAFHVPDRGTGWAADTFYAYQLGYCERQMYLTKLGLKDNSDISGRFGARRLIQDHFEHHLDDAYPELEVTPRVQYRTDAITIVGRPTCYNPASNRVYHLRPRNGWYRFHPPVDRHIDQLQAYLQAAGADEGRLVYVSMADLQDLRFWPGDEYLAFDADRFGRIIARAETVYEEILANGVASNPDEIPFPRCGCYLCESETLALANDDTPPSADTAPAEDESIDTGTPEVASLTDGGQILAADREADVLACDTYHVPADLRELDVWVVWNEREKIARAPWQSGTMYPCQWAQDSEHDPRRPFEKAKMVSELSIERIHDSWPFPDTADLPEVVTPAVLLPHPPAAPDPPLVVLDFDDVRDPDSGEVSGEVLELVEQLGAYAEVSRSGTGIHVYVRGALPSDIEMISGPLDGPGRVEIYDHSRFVGSTWRHIEGTPLNTVPEAQAMLTAIATRYDPDLAPS